MVYPREMGRVPHRPFLQQKGGVGQGASHIGGRGIKAHPPTLPPRGNHYHLEGPEDMPKIGDMKVIKSRHVCRWNGEIWRIVWEAPCLRAAGGA